MSITYANSENRHRFFEIDFSQTNIEGSNSKKIPAEKIITRRSASSSNSSSSKGSVTGTLENGLSVSPKETSNTLAQNSSSPKGSLKSSLRNSPIGELKRILSNSSTNIFKPIKFGSRKNTISDRSSSPSEPPSPVKTPTAERKSMKSWKQIVKTDSIDQTIIDNKDLKKIFVHSYNIDVKNVKKIDDFLNENTVALSPVNSIPKPPRISLDLEKENLHEIQKLMHEENTIEKSLELTSSITKSA